MAAPNKGNIQNNIFFGGHFFFLTKTEVASLWVLTGIRLNTRTQLFKASLATQVFLLKKCE